MDNIPYDQVALYTLRQVTGQKPSVCGPLPPVDRLSLAVRQHLLVAHLVYNSNSLEYAQQLKLPIYPIDRINQNTIAVRVTSRRAIIGCRGTDNISDLVTDVHIAIGTVTPRFVNDLRDVQDWIAVNPHIRLSFAGHSLGASIAVHIATMLKTPLGGHIFNPAPVYAETPVPHSPFYVHCIVCDPVSMAFASPGNHQFKFYLLEPRSTIVNHHILEAALRFHRLSSFINRSITPSLIPTHTHTAKIAALSIAAIILYIMYHR
jgi:hypothetical protein